MNYSQLASQLRKELEDEGLINIRFLSASRRKIVAKDAFKAYFKKIDNIEQAQTRTELVHAKSDTKRKRIAPQNGLYIAGNAYINNRPLPEFYESTLFLKNIPTVEENTLIIGVENFDNLVYWREQRYFFEDDKELLFVYRNKKMLDFLESTTNSVLYFGDFDLAGISIYENEIRKRNKETKLFIPQGIETLLEKYGSSKLYMQQFNQFKNLTSKLPEVENLIKMIHKYQKGLEQEFFIQSEGKNENIIT
ncbi:hypothetical protein [Sulfurimonas sp.]|uniref:DUF7281 domain-containing protein n=1 Tax=Sulfurimonas sp. TaxID=2022749 RepID=UPI0026263C7C|nr:hypothetical protein [Sulfurimonas sp.]